MMTITNPKISLVTPSFNQGAFIERTIHSVLQQTYPAWEYLVIDGGSSDRTVAVLQKYTGKISWVSEQDRGQTHAINKGLQQTTGDIVAYLNSDDCYFPDTLETVAKFFAGHPEVMCLAGDYWVVNENDQRIQSLVVRYKKVWRACAHPWGLYLTNYIPQPSTFWRRELLEKIGYLDESLRYTMDYDYWLRIIRHYPIYLLSKPLSTFRVHSHSKRGSQYRQLFREDELTAARYTDNQILLFLHRLHNRVIELVYDVL